MWGRMNIIQCSTCHELLAPVLFSTPTLKLKTIKTCLCGLVSINIIEPGTEYYNDVAVEVILKKYRIKSKSGEWSYERTAKARVIKINNGFLFPDKYVGNLDDPHLADTLFSKQNSQIIITSIEEAGKVKIVDKFTLIKGDKKWYHFKQFIENLKLIRKKTT